MYLTHPYFLMGVITLLVLDLATVDMFGLLANIPIIIMVIAWPFVCRKYVVKEE